MTRTRPLIATAAIAITILAGCKPAPPWECPSSPPPRICPDPLPGQPGQPCYSPCDADQPRGAQR